MEKKMLDSVKKCENLHWGVFWGAEFKNCRIQALFPWDQAQNPRCLPTKMCFSFITRNKLILSPINVLKLNIKLVIVDILVPSTCLYVFQFLRYSK